MEIYLTIPPLLNVIYQYYCIVSYGVLPTGVVQGQVCLKYPSVEMT